jgi:DNA-binding transcriptional LysR family regulator
MQVLRAGCEREQRIGERSVDEPEWGDFRVVLALSRGGSVAGAARLLGVDSSTVSRRLAAIEQSLGACLVVRGGREFAFTAEGKAAVAAAEAMESVVANTAATIRAIRTAIDGVVKVSAVPSMLRTFMALLPAATEKYPRLSIEFSAAVKTVDLAKGEADIAIRMSQPRELDLIAKRAFEMGFCVFASKAYLDRHGAPTHPDQLREHKLIRYSEHMLHLPWFAWLETHANKGAPAMRADGTEMATSLVAAGSGIGVLPAFSGDHSPELIRVFAEPIAFAVGWIVYHETARASARVRAVIELLTEFVAAKSEELSGRRAS